MMKKAILPLILITCLSAGMTSGTCLAEAVSVSPDETITVSGTGTVTVAPDTAQISLAVQTTADSTAEAQSQNAEVTNRVISALEEAGVAQKNIATSGLDIYANYHYDDYGNGTLSGYTVTTRLTISKLAVENVGSLIDTATSAGANQVNGISYSYSDSITAYDQAMEAALDRAHEKAQKIADKEGLTLGAIAAITENSSNYYGETVDAGSYRAEATADSSIQVLAGEDTISATVSVTYTFE